MPWVYRKTYQSSLDRLAPWFDRDVFLNRFMTDLLEANIRYGFGDAEAVEKFVNGELPTLPYRETYDHKMSALVHKMREENPDLIESENLWRAVDEIYYYFFDDRRWQQQ